MEMAMNDRYTVTYRFTELDPNRYDEIKNLMTNKILLKPINGIECFYVGLFYFKDQDYENAERYFLMAIEYLNINAMNNLAVLYGHFTKNYAKAEEYFLMAIKYGHADAVYNLAMFYINIIKDHKKAKICFKVALEKKDADAMNSIAVYYERTKKHEKAQSYYRKATSMANKIAILNFANFYVQLRKFVDAKDYFQVFLDCHDDKNPDALFGMAMCYKHEQNLEKEELFLKKAVENGKIFAMITLGKNYFIAGKYENAEHYFQLAVNNHDASALFHLALLNEKLQKFDNTKKYLLMAIDNGSKTSMLYLANIYANEKNYEDAERYYLMAIDHEFINVYDLLIQFHKKHHELKHYNFYQEQIQIKNKKIETSWNNLLNLGFLDNETLIQCTRETLCMYDVFPNNEISLTLRPFMALKRM